MISDSNGFVVVLRADGVYNLDFRSGGVSLRSIEGIPIFDLADMRADLDGVMAGLATEVTDRANAITAEATARANADTAEATARANAITAEATARGNADAALAAAIAALDTDTYSKAEVDAAIGAAHVDLTPYALKTYVDDGLALKPDTGLVLLKSGNLGGLASVATSRTNLSVYSKAEVDALIPVVQPSLQGAVTKPVIGDWTLQNAGASAALATISTGVKLSDTSNSAAMRFAKYNTAPNGTNFTATFRLGKLKPDSINGAQCCILMRNSTNGRILWWGDYLANQWLAQQWTAYGTFSGNLSPGVAQEGGRFPWRRIVRSGDNLSLEASEDGINWGVWITTTVSVFLTATGGGALDEIGFGIMASDMTVARPGGTILTSFTLV
jgi:hypothetical protein